MRLLPKPRQTKTGTFPGSLPLAYGVHLTLTPVLHHDEREQSDHVTQRSRISGNTA
jgi:hypothetical protein